MESNRESFTAIFGNPVKFTKITYVVSRLDHPAREEAVRAFRDYGWIPSGIISPENIQRGMVALRKEHLIANARHSEGYWQVVDPDDAADAFPVWILDPYEVIPIEEQDAKDATALLSTPSEQAGVG